MAAEPDSTTPPAEPAPEAAAVSEPPRDDYYTRRAKSVLEAEKSSAQAPHPLAARHPGMDVIVCEAGCPDRKGPEVVYVRRQVPAGEITETREAKMVPTAETGAASATPSDPVCVAGCYVEASVPQDDAEPVASWYPSTPTAPAAPRDKLSPIR